MATDREKLPNASPTIARIRSSVAVLSDFSQSIASADKTKADDHSQDTTGRYKSHNKIRVLYYLCPKLNARIVGKFYRTRIMRILTSEIKCV